MGFSDWGAGEGASWHGEGRGALLLPDPGEAEKKGGPALDLDVQIMGRQASQQR